MNRYEQSARLANDLAKEMARGVKNPGYPWIYNKWLRRQDNPAQKRYWHGDSDVKLYDLTLHHQAEWALENLTADDLERQATELLAATNLTPTPCSWCRPGRNRRMDRPNSRSRPADSRALREGMQ